MRVRSCIAWLAVAAALAGCAAAPPAELPSLEDSLPPAVEPENVVVPVVPLIESPPIEPVQIPEPVLPAPVAPTGPTPSGPAPEARPAPPAGTPTAPTVPAPVTPPVTVAPEPVEDTVMQGLLADLSRYGALTPDDLKRELATATQALARQRSDVNRVRLAVLYTLSRTSPQDDQRALQLFDNVAKSGGGATPVKQLAAVLNTQVAERQRAVRDEQQKANEAVRKLDQLLEMERTLLRDRVRSGGGGGGGGGGGSSGGH